jgi:CubicO group peptidase (beta-lactamase class C family)
VKILRLEYRFLIVALSILLMVACSNYAEEPVEQVGTTIGSIDTSIEAEVDRLFEVSGIPSMAVAVVVGEETVWAKGYGEQPDLSTLYMIGSIDKPFLATSLLQLNEQGRLSLDDDINDYLSFDVRNPHAPDVPITLRMLATHRSGLVHDVPGLRYVDNDGPMLRWRFWHQTRRLSDFFNSFLQHSRDEIIETAFTSSEPDQIWSSPPNSGYQYSNTGFGDLLGRAIEDVEGKPFQQVIQDNIIIPLGMENTGFEASDFPKEQLAIPYARFDDGYTALPLTGSSGSGRLRSTAPDLARFLAMQMNGGTLDGIQILTPMSIELMHARDVELSGFDFPSMELYGQGIGWLLWGNGLQGHSGAIPGFFSQIIYQEVEGGIPYGVVLMMNTGCSVVECDFVWFDEYFVAIRELLLAFAGEIAHTPMAENKVKIEQSLPSVS